ncbi:ectonucleoside triphosphate diphosphohydrolase 5-like isoform X2 [Leptotrombidium deliense]|uniref:Ectonucleoside triphosphate diphosphohydrolase 5-like isoform X2 n=1 Tax=Leptotrombidium deliense TaxID=299467 RepID=A0A443RXQ0_9ACAR|nr:ectonucleoside triphosphate diphosphohydrolase 5-like isoform X2 [Leptotrombidium deliense]
MNAVDSTIKTYPFKRNTLSVSVMDSSAEGVNAWLTINYLLGYIQPSKKTVAVLDLGGGSTQVSYEMKNIETNEFDVRFMQVKNVFGHAYIMYTRSFLGNGILSARKQILLQSNQAFVDEYRTILSNDESNEHIYIISHPCIPEGKYAKWNFENKTFYVYSFSNGNTSAYNINCYELITSFVNSSIHLRFFEKKNINNHKIFAISHYYQLASLFGVPNSGVIAVGDYLKYAKIICPQLFENEIDLNKETFLNHSLLSILNKTQKANILSQNPFICLDLTYITVVLNKGFGLSMSKNLNVVEKINGYEASWALGLAINSLDYSENHSNSYYSLITISTVLLLGLKLFFDELFLVPYFV